MKFSQAIAYLVNSGDWLKAKRMVLAIVGQCVIYDISAGLLLFILINDHPLWFMITGSLLMGSVVQTIVHTMALRTRNPLHRIVLVAFGVLAGTGVIYMTDINVPEHAYAFHDFIYCVSAGLFFGILYLALALNQARQARLRKALRRQEERRKRAEEQLELSHYRLLAAQIRPHFLINVFSNLLALVHEDASRAEALINSLTKYLSDIAGHAREIAVPLEAELNTVEAYLAIQNERMQRLTYSIAAPDGMRMLAVPPLTILTLVENAIKHGIKTQSGCGSIFIRCGLDENSIAWIEVADNGTGRAQADGRAHPDTRKTDAPPGHGIGLKNVRMRLCALHGPNCKVSLHPDPVRGCIARMTMPIVKYNGAVHGTLSHTQLFKESVT